MGGPHVSDCYFVVLLGLLGLVVLLGLLGVVGLVVLLPLELGDVVLLEPMPLELGVLVLPLVAPPALPDLLKYASHSERETDPSLFVSTAENSGAMAPDAPPVASLDAPPLDAPPLPDVLDDPVALGEELEPLDDDP